MLSKDSTLVQDFLNDQISLNERENHFLIKHFANPKSNPEDDSYIAETANLAYQIGIIDVEGTKSIAGPFINSVMERIKSHDDKSEFQTCYSNVEYHGYLYGIIDLSKYELEEGIEFLKTIDSQTPIDPLRVE